MLRAIQEIQPRYVVGENVRGLISWNGGLVFDEVQTDLEAEGYTVIPFVLPACGVNAPHRRERVWFVAYRDGLRGSQKYDEQQSEVYQQYGKGRIAPNTDNARNTASRSGIVGDWTENVIERELAQSESDRYSDAANANCQRDERFSTDLGTSESSGQRRESIKTVRNFGCAPDWDFFPTQPPICGGDDGVSRELDGITFPKWRSESIKAYGNAIVPQVAYEIFKVIDKLENSFIKYL